MRRSDGDLTESCEDQEQTKRIDILKQIPCIKFVSFEPLLGLIEYDLTGIDWAIVGGESGKGFRPVQNAWVEILRQDCEYYKVPFFFKQWGGNYPKENGRELNGKIYDEYPLIQIKSKQQDR